MDIRDLRPASDFATQYGVKSVVYGIAGTSKTPLINTAPRPLLCAVEPGLLSMRDSTVPTWIAPTPARIDEFLRWLWGSHEANNFDTVAFDSVSQMAELVLLEELGRNKDGRAAYGKMSIRVMEWVDGLFFQKNKHVYLVCKQMEVDQSGLLVKRPYFPGKDLNVKIPHRYDEILHIAEVPIPGVQGARLAFRTKSSHDVLARDRSGKLAEFEPPHLGQLFNKILGA